MRGQQCLDRLNAMLVLDDHRPELLCIQADKLVQLSLLDGLAIAPELARLAASVPPRLDSRHRERFRALDVLGQTCLLQLILVHLLTGRNESWSAGVESSSVVTVRAAAPGLRRGCMPRKSDCWRDTGAHVALKPWFSSMNRITSANDFSCSKYNLLMIGSSLSHSPTCDSTLEAILALRQTQKRGLTRRIIRGDAAYGGPRGKKRVVLQQICM